MPKIRHLDNLVDEPAKGKPMKSSCERDHQQRVRPQVPPRTQAAPGRSVPRTKLLADTEEVTGRTQYRPPFRLPSQRLI
jgi:hypothetical protein